MKSLIFSLLSVFSFSLPVFAHQTVEVTGAFALETAPGMANAAAYVDLTNTGSATASLMGVSLGDASQGLAGQVQIHTHIMDGDLMRMVEIPEPLMMMPGQGLEMRPGGIHIMFLGLSAPLAIGETIEVVLHLDGDHTRDLTVQIPVISSDDMPLSKAMGMHDSHKGHADHHDHQNHGDDEDHSGHNH